MPNGFTAKIYDGTSDSLREYLMHVARGFGFAIMQRDDDWNAPLERVTPSDYHKRAIEDAQEKLRALCRLSYEDIVKRCRKERDEAVQKWNDRNEENEQMRYRYDDMIAKVEAWEVTSPFTQKVKDQALEYLRSSKDFDVYSDEDQRRFNSYPPLKDPEEWLKEQKAALERSIEYHERENREEVKRADERNKWIDAFYKDLPDA